MLQPQPDDEIRPVVEALRRLDPLLAIKWQPEAVLVERGAYSVLGKATRPTYDGRWQIVRYETPSKLHDDRDYAVIITVTAIDASDPGRCMISRGPYAPIGAWVVDYMQRWDSAQARFADEMDKVWAQHEMAERGDVSNQHALNQEVLNRVFRQLGGQDQFSTGGHQSESRGERSLILTGK